MILTEGARRAQVEIKDGTSGWPLQETDCWMYQGPSEQPGHSMGLQINLRGVPKI